MLSLIGSIQPDPFSPEHVPQAKQGRVRSPQPPPQTHPVLDANESRGSDASDEELQAPAWPDESDNVMRNAKRGPNKPEGMTKKPEKKRKRNKNDAAGSKSETKLGSKPKRKKNS